METIFLSFVTLHSFFTLKKDLMFYMLLSLKKKKNTFWNIFSDDKKLSMHPSFLMLKVTESLYENYILNRKCLYFPVHLESFLICLQVLNF